MKTIIALVALIALSVAGVASAQHIVLRKCGFTGSTLLLESGASSHASSKINSVQARIAAAVQASEVKPGDPIFAKLKATKAPFTVKTIVPRHSFSSSPKPYAAVPSSLSSRLVKVWPACPAGSNAGAQWADAWNAAASSFTDAFSNNVDQAQYFESALLVYAVAKAACDACVNEGVSAPATTGASIQPNGDCHVSLKFTSSLEFEPKVPLEKFKRFVKN